MASHSTHHTEPAGSGFLPDELFHLLERNEGRLHVLEFASLGLAKTIGKEAACLVWVLDDILTDIEQMGNILREVGTGSGENNQ